MTSAMLALIRVYQMQTTYLSIIVPQCTFIYYRNNNIHILCCIWPFACHTKSPVCFEIHMALQWCHNERRGVSNHQSHDCLLKDERKHQSSASLAFVRGIHRGPVNSSHKWPITQKMFPFDDVIIDLGYTTGNHICIMLTKCTKLLAFIFPTVI